MDQKTIDAIIKTYISSSDGRRKLAETMVTPIRARIYGRCEHGNPRPDCEEDACQVRRVMES
jgi:hypothetical protein